MTTAELAIVSTTIVGVSAVLAPALTAWAGRKHERKQTRSTRRYEQRRTLYTDVAVSLERTRMSLVRRPTERTFPEPPTTETADEWIDLMARAAVHGSNGVKKKLDDLDQAERDFYRDLNWVREEGDEGDYESLEEQRKELVELVDGLERTMRDELETL
jgi:hypothetical protein